MVNLEERKKERKKANKPRFFLNRKSEVNYIRKKEWKKKQTNKEREQNEQKN